MSRKEAKQAARQRQSTRQLLGLQAVTAYSLITEHGGEQVFFLLKPDNLSVLPDAGIAARIYALMTVLKGVAELEFLCLNSRESFEANKRFLRGRMEAEEEPAVYHLLEADLRHLDQLQVQMASSREFLVVIRLDKEQESEALAFLNRMEKLLREQGFSVKRAEKEEIKRVLAVYFEQNVTTEVFEDFDGERWMIPEG